MTNVVWIIGGSTGIGRAVALQLARQGAQVVVSARSRDKLDALAQAASNISALPLDVSDHEAVTKAAAFIEETHGPITLMFYCAAYWEPGKASDLSRAAFEPAFTINLLGAVSAIEAVLPYMRMRKSGHIALVSSIAGYRGLPRAEAYGASKAAMTYVAEAMRLTLQSEGIKVQVISPGFVDTPLTAHNDFPMPFMITAEDAAQRVVKGLASQRFEITFPKRFTFLLKILRCLPYGLYFPLVRKVTLKHSRGASK